MSDGEDADATLRTARVTDEVMASALVGVGYGCVYDLDKFFRHCEVRRQLWDFKCSDKNHCGYLKIYPSRIIQCFFRLQRSRIFVEEVIQFY